MTHTSGKVVVAGQGYVGLPLAVRAAEVGFDVVGYEPDAERLQRLLNGDSYVEDVSSSALLSSIESGRYFPTGELGKCADFDIAVITVPTPLSEGSPDLTHIEESARELAPFVRTGATVILESTTYPGTTDELLVPILEKGSELRAGVDFHVGYSPERIDPGNRVWTFSNTPKVVSGIDEASLSSVKTFYDALVEITVPESGTRVAEMTKLLENTFRHVNVALVNELAMFAGELGVDVWEAISAASTKPFGFMTFTPGPGVGGHCLPVDPSYLSWKVKQTLGSTFRFVELANDVNDHMPHYVVQRAVVALNRARKAVNGAHVLVLGLAYKPNSGDVRESPGPVICDRLVALGANVAVVDPLLGQLRLPRGVTRVDLTRQGIAEADLVIVVTDHDAFDWEQVVDTARWVLDTRHRLPSSPNVEYL